MLVTIGSRALGKVTVVVVVVYVKNLMLLNFSPFVCLVCGKKRSIEVLRNIKSLRSLNMKGNKICEEGIYQDTVSYRNMIVTIKRNVLLGNHSFMSLDQGNG